jgi:hypothetical protein
MHNLRATYKTYTATFEKKVDINTYLKILSKFFLFFMDYVFRGFEVSFPNRMGSVLIIGKKVKPKLDEEGNIKNLAPNWAKTKELWDNDPEAKKNKTLVYCFNEHSDGIRYKFLWSKIRVILDNKNLFSIRFTRDNKRMINTKVKEGAEYLVKN